uniref:Upstream transcription factor 2, c-fos interacting n=1 Tax=Eptatretus burgeri TaxID=7764 RepID=A0A8C4N2G4_EPTBU
MDVLEQGLDTGHGKVQDGDDGPVQLQDGEVTGAEEQVAASIATVQQATSFASDPNIQYHFRTENNGGQVTYRVVQVADGQGDGPGTAVIQSPFTGGGSPPSDGAERLISPSGQFYVMMASQDVLQGGVQRTIAPRTHPYTQKGDGSRTPRDERRRAQHNEVERRRRDKINNWIVQLSKVIPDCSRDHTKTGQPEETSGSPEPPLCLPAQSKGGILSKACDYIQELRQTNQHMMEALKETERVQMDNELLRQKLEDLESERSLLRAQLQQHGIEIMGSGPGQ